MAQPQYGKLSRSDDGEGAAGGQVSGVATAAAVKAEPASKLGQVLLAWLCLVLAVLSGSAIGPTFKWFQQHNIHELLAASWRCQVMALILIPLALVEARYRNPREWLTLERKPEHKYSLPVYILVAGAAWAVNLVCWIVGLEYTTTVRASIFAGMHPLMLLMYYYWTGKKVSLYEWVGVTVSFCGLVFIVVFSDGLLYKAVLGSSHRVRGGGGDPEGDQAWIGDLLCLLASAAEVVVIVNRDATKGHVPTIAYTCCTTICVAIMSSICASFYTSATFFCTEENCLFGWMAPKWLWVMVCFGFVVGVVCVGGFNFAMNYINPLVFSCVLLVDPAVTGFISFLIGVEGIPDFFTITGGLIVVAGVALVTVGEHQMVGPTGGNNGRNDGAKFEMIKLHDDADDDIWNDSSVDDVDLNDESLF